MPYTSILHDIIFMYICVIIRSCCVDKPTSTLLCTYI